MPRVLKSRNLVILTGLEAKTRLESGQPPNRILRHIQSTKCQKDRDSDLSFRWLKADCELMLTTSAANLLLLSRVCSNAHKTYILPKVHDE